MSLLGQKEGRDTGPLLAQEFAQTQFPQLQCFSMASRTLRYIKDYVQNEIGAASSWTTYLMTDCPAELRVVPLPELLSENIHLLYKRDMNRKHNCFLSLFFWPQPLDHGGHHLVALGETPQMASLLPPTRSQ